MTTTKQWMNHDDISFTDNQTVPGTLAKTKIPARSISPHKLHHQFAQPCTRSVSKPMQQFSSHGAVARFCATALIGWTPYSLAKLRFFGSPMARQNLCGIPQDGHTMDAKRPARQPARCLASYPRNFPAMAGQWQTRCRRMTGEATRKTTCVTPDLAAQWPHRQLARQLATWLRNGRTATVRTTATATSRERLVGFSPSAFNHDIRRL